MDRTRCLVELLLRGADGNGTVLTQDEASVWLLKVDSFLLHHTILSTYCEGSLSRTPGCANGLLNKAATGNVTTWLNWNFSVL